MRTLVAEYAARDVLDVAEELFGNVGFAETSIKRLAAAVELSPGTIYKLYQNKMAIRDAVLGRRFDEIKLATAAICSDGLDGLNEFLELIAYTDRHFQRHAAFGRLAHQTFPPTPHMRADAPRHSPGIELTGPFLSALSRGQAEGTVRDVDLKWLAFQVRGIVFRHHSMTLGQRGLTVPTDELISVIRQVLAKPPALPASG